MNHSEILSSFKHKANIQIRFKDIDKQGHVNNAVHLTYFETGRSSYFKKVIGKNNWTESGIVLASTTIDYKRPILLEDELFCHTKIARLGAKSFDVEHILTIENGTTVELAAIGKSVMVCFNYSLNQTIAIPDSWEKVVRLFEKL